MLDDGSPAVAILQGHVGPVLTTLRALRRRIRCEFRTDGLHRFDLRSGRCMYCGALPSPRAAAVGVSPVPRRKAVRLDAGGASWLAWLVKNTRAITSRLRSTVR